MWTERVVLFIPNYSQRTGTKFPEEIPVQLAVIQFACSHVIVASSVLIKPLFMLRCVRRFKSKGLPHNNWQLSLSRPVSFALAAIQPITSTNVNIQLNWSVRLLEPAERRRRSPGQEKPNYWRGRQSGQKMKLHSLTHSQETLLTLTVNFSSHSTFKHISFHPKYPLERVRKKHAKALKRSSDSTCTVVITPKLRAHGNLC